MEGAAAREPERQASAPGPPPLNHEVGLVLASGRVLRGKLQLADPKLWLEASGRPCDLLLRIGATECDAKGVGSWLRRPSDLPLGAASFSLRGLYWAPAFGFLPHRLIPDG